MALLFFFSVTTWPKYHTPPTAPTAALTTTIHSEANFGIFWLSAVYVRCVSDGLTTPCGRNDGPGRAGPAWLPYKPTPVRAAPSNDTSRFQLVPVDSNLEAAEGSLLDQGLEAAVMAGVVLVALAIARWGFRATNR